MALISFGAKKGIQGLDHFGLKWGTGFKIIRLPIPHQKLREVTSSLPSSAKTFSNRV